MRKTQDISQGWKFWTDENSGKSETVSLPHCVRLSPANSSGGRNYQGICNYQKNIFISDKSQGKTLLLEFGGAMGVSKLFVNGALVNTCHCGYIPFRTDISECVIYGRKNEICIELDNRDNAEVPPGKPQQLLDFCYDGGLYRTAKLIIKQPVHITDELLENERAGGGVFLYSENVSEKDALVNAKVHISNTKDTGASVKVVFSFYHQQGELVSKVQTIQNCSAHEKLYVTQTVKVEKPRLWSCDNPNVYTAKIDIFESGKCTDTYECCYGIREFQFTYKENFKINGERKRLSGANYHATYPYIGNALPQQALRRDAKKLREIGMENVRSHYPFAPEFLDECNRCGLTVIVSNPGWQWFQEGIFAQRLIENMRNIVRWQRNHPCIVLWEPMPNESVVPDEVQQQLHDAVHEEYPYASCFTASDHGPTDVSYRMYDPGMLQPGMEGYNPIKRYGAKSDYPVWIREYGDAPDNWTDQNCAWRTPRAWGDDAQLRAVWRMLGKDSQCQTNNYINMYNNELLCGYGIWPAMEHNRGYHSNPCWGGFWDMFRIPKMTAQFMESQCDAQKHGYVLHLATWWTDISPDDVTVFSNAQTVKLYHDGVLVEEQKPLPIAVKHPPFVFKNVHQRFKTRDRSTLYAEAFADGKIVATQQIKTPGAPVKLALSADLQEVPAGKNDCIIVRCEVKDAEGGIVPRSADAHPILFEAQGADIIGDASIGANPVCPQAGIAAILVRPRFKQFTISAKMFWAQTNARIAIQPDTLVVSCE